MTDLPALISSLASSPGPALTAYAPHRVELSGPVAARWLAKIANLLADELADPFSPDPRPGRLRAALDPWQRVVWETAARGMGWEVLGSRPGPRPLAGDVLVSHEDDEEVAAALAAGAWALLQPRDFLAFGWDGADLPDGAVDALAAIMSQPDSLVCAPPTPTPSLEAAVAEGLRGEAPVAPVGGTRVALVTTGPSYPSRVLDQWLSGRSVVLVDPRSVAPDEAERALAAERVDGGWVAYSA
ncbi:TIGR03089 family protein [Actinomyces sp. B33]|uniref:TIGR03089 family protein n=1 Tax=Actinomyces sp. B33 TaxID=2942131 RepID=UPI002340F456|nr:TIGR03089 family protein [Actinomyces sp. B33]MDC4232660.1 TIGR03089 family protein [Actinomyces sp. B33]